MSRGKITSFPFFHCLWPCSEIIQLTFTNAQSSFIKTTSPYFHILHRLLMIPATNRDEHQPRSRRFNLHFLMFKQVKPRFFMVKPIFFMVKPPFWMQKKKIPKPRLCPWGEVMTQAGQKNDDQVVFLPCLLMMYIYNYIYNYIYIY